jgi:hypothetical protein
MRREWCGGAVVEADWEADEPDNILEGGPLTEDALNEVVDGVEDEKGLFRLLRLCPPVPRPSDDCLMMQKRRRRRKKRQGQQTYEGVQQERKQKNTENTERICFDVHNSGANRTALQALWMSFQQFQRQVLVEIHFLPGQCDRR